MSAIESIATPVRPTSPFGQRVVRVVAELRREIERDREPGLTAFEEEAEARVRLLGRAVARVLAHRPGAAAVHRRVGAARERELAGKLELAPVEGRPPCRRASPRCRSRSAGDPRRSPSRAKARRWRRTAASRRPPARATGRGVGRASARSRARARDRSAARTAFRRDQPATSASRSARSAFSRRVTSSAVVAWVPESRLKIMRSSPTLPYHSYTASRASPKRRFGSSISAQRAESGKGCTERQCAEHAAKSSRSSPKWA